MKDNFSMHNWRLQQAIKEIDEATFTDKHDDNPELKGGQKDLPDEVIQELVENRKFRENYEKQQNEIQTKTQRDRDFQNFLEAYPDTKADSIPLSVWETVEKGESLVNAYMRYENQLLKQKLNIEQKNQENVNSSIGAVRSSGTTSPFYTREQVSKMSTAEVNQNWKQVQESMKKW